MPHKCGNCAYDIPHQPDTVVACSKCGWSEWSATVGGYYIPSSISNTVVMKTQVNKPKASPPLATTLKASSLYTEMYEILKGKGSKPNGK
jgi:hypothetical protein